MTPREPGNEFARYAIRLAEQAIRDRAEAVAWLAENIGDEYARAWYGGLNDAISTLAQQPRRYAVQPNESRLLRREVRRLLYRMTPTSAAAYLVFYEVREGAGADGPTVFIAHIRHTARKPLTSQEARGVRDLL